MLVVLVLNVIFVADALIEDIVTVEAPEDRKPVATTDGVEEKAGVKVIVVIDPELEYE